MSKPRGFKAHEGGPVSAHAAQLVPRCLTCGEKLPATPEGHCVRSVFCSVGCEERGDTASKSLQQVIDRYGSL